MINDQQTISTSCHNQQVMHTECPVCDYLLTTCYLNGNVLEAYAGNSYVVNKATSTAARKSKVKSFL